MNKTTAILFIGLIALMVLSVACSKAVQQSQTSDQTGAAIDMASDADASAPQDVGTLDDLPVSDGVPQ